MSICISPLDGVWAFMSIYFAIVVLLLPVPRSFLLWRALTYYMIATTVVAAVYTITQLIELKTNTLRAIPIDLLIDMEVCTLAMIPPARYLLSAFGQHSSLRKYMCIWIITAVIGGVIGCVAVDSLCSQADWSLESSTTEICQGHEVSGLGFLPSPQTPQNEIAQIRIYLISVFSAAAICLGIVLLVQSDKIEGDEDSEANNNQAACWRPSTTARTFLLFVFDIISLAVALFMVIPTEQLLSRLNLPSDRQYGSIALWRGYSLLLTIVAAVALTVARDMLDPFARPISWKSCDK
ncbi:hypothetical protein CMUS01_11782 [Colletotrichum musicola]|uniref:Uncharacterized protein n=1 Tax=Colletotrichum musicola TaxID=2175873 RepID=A0A8H6N4A2_9PEZI|nr:hypothetical protein CMUS01_11782 [Colletotrichum musicola]